MKKKKIIYISVAIIISIIIAIFVMVIILNNSNNSLIKNGLENINTGATDLDTNIDNKELIKSKLEVIRNRFRIKDIISKWDNYFQNEQLWLAIIQYKIALNKTPDDYKIIEKIGDIFYEMKKFNEANSYYFKLLNKPWFDSTKYILSLIFSKDISKDWNITLLKNEIEKNITDKEKVFFYTNSLYCLEDFHQCKRIFDEKIITDKDTIKSPELIEIKNTIKTYNDFWLVNLYYKNSLIIWSFMKLKLYPISIELWKKLLEEKQDYKAIIQIIAQSYFDLWNYKFSNVYLKKYFELTPTDSNASYILWIINLKLEDYIISNIFLNKALYLWYSDTLNVKRKIAYNYFMLKDQNKLFILFDDIIKTEKKITKDDLNIMINYSIENNKNDKTYEWIKRWLHLFPKEPLFYAYMWKIELDIWKNSLASIYLMKWLRIDKNNQLLNYVYWLLNLKENKNDIALEYFQKAYDLDKKSPLAKEILKNIDEL